MLGALGAQQVQATAEMNMNCAMSATVANQRVQGLVDGIVKQGKGLFAPADGGLAIQLDGRRTDQNGAAELEFDLDAVFLEQIVPLLE